VSNNFDIFKSSLKKHTMRTLVFLLALCLVVPAFGQRNKKGEETSGVLAGKLAEEGVVYALPRTGIRIYVNATKTDYTPGPYSRFADQLLGIGNVASEPSSSWAINDVRLETYSEPDPTQVFKTKGLGASTIGLTPDGCLAGINSAVSVEPRGGIVTNPAACINKMKPFQFTNLSDEPFFSSGDSTGRYRAARLTIDQKAAQAAARVLDCRKLKYEIVAGLLDELPPDGQGYEASLKQLDNLEKEYLSLFAGVSVSNDFDFSFEYTPSSQDTKGDVVFRFSEQQGVLDKSDVTGKPVMIELSKVADLSSNYDKLKSSDNPSAGFSGVYYRLPGLADVRLIQELKVIATARFPVAQFGSVAPVPESLLDGNYSIEFHPETGAIKKVEKVGPGKE
jgi:hypothetical protein